MKKIKINLVIFLLMICTLFMCGIIQNKNLVYASNSTSMIVMDSKTNRVLYENNAREKKYMASTTKILTALCVIENCDINSQVVVKKETTGVEGSSIYLEEGEILTVKDLLYGLMLRSGNDCAETLAEFVSGSIEKFAELMNITAKKIGAFNSNFVNPHGLHDDNHYTTAYDLALISCYAIKNPIFKEICSTKKITIPFTTRNTKRVLINKNKLLNRLDGATGIKTGFTKKAGRCLVSSCERNGNEIVSVVLNCGPMFEESEKLINNAFNEFSFIKLLESDEIVDFIAIKNSDEKCAVISKRDIILPLNEEEKNNIKIEYEIPNEINKNISKEDEIGKINIFIKNNLIFSEKLYTIIDIKNI